MRLLYALACCISLQAVDVAQLRKLEESDRIFELRRALQEPGGSADETRFYRAVVAARFGHEAQAIEELRNFVAGRSTPGLDRKAYEELGSALLRMWRYGEAASALTEALRLTPANDPDRAENENTRELFETIRDVPPQTIQMEGVATIPAKLNPASSWDIPVEMNGHSSEWLLDTGANLSLISESEAKRMGLFLRDTSAHVAGSTGKSSPLRLAIGKDLRIGSAHLTNVIFIAVADDALYFAPIKYGIKGVLGLPVMRALGRIEMSREGVLRASAAVQ